MRRAIIAAFCSGPTMGTTAYSAESTPGRFSEDAPVAYDAPAATLAGLYCWRLGRLRAGTLGRLKFNKRDEGDYETVELLSFDGEGGCRLRKPVQLRL